MSKALAGCVVEPLITRTGSLVFDCWPEGQNRRAIVRNVGLTIGRDDLSDFACKKCIAAFKLDKLTHIQTEALKMKTELVNSMMDTTLRNQSAMQWGIESASLKQRAPSTNSCIPMYSPRRSKQQENISHLGIEQHSQQQAATRSIQQHARAISIQQQAATLSIQQQARAISIQQQAATLSIQQHARAISIQQQARAISIQQQARPISIQQQVSLK